MTVTFRIVSALLALLTSSVLCAGQVDYMPITFRTLEGIRPFIPVSLNGKRFLFMVHSNAGFYVQTTHANAKAAGVEGQPGVVAFGIDKPGHVSSLGMTKGTLQTLEVGETIDHSVSLSVFEVPMPEMDGMLGIGWLRANGVIVNYDRPGLGFTATVDEASAEDARLVKEGFTKHAMRWDEKSHRYSVIGKINGKAARLVVSTVGYNILDISFADDAGLQLGPVVHIDDGPTGAEVPNYLTKRPLEIVIDSQVTAWTQPIVQNTYAYSKADRPREAASQVDGYLGCDFMLANEAVIDFRSNTLLLRPVLPSEKHAKKNSSR